MRLVAKLLPLFLLFPAQLAAQESRADTLRTAAVMGALVQAKSRLQAGVTEPAVRDNIQAISDATDRILARWREAGRPALPQDYLRSLNANVLVLDSLATAPVDTGLVYVALFQPPLRDIRDDLTLKVAFAGGALGAAAEFPALVHVTVLTRRNNQEVSGLWVRANPKLIGRSGAPMFVFSAASSPTTRDLPPGNYVMWVESTAGEILAEQPATVGATGGRTESISFAIR